MTSASDSGWWVTSEFSSQDFFLFFFIICAVEANSGLFFFMALKCSPVRQTSFVFVEERQVVNILFKTRPCIIKHHVAASCRC